MFGRWLGLVAAGAVFLVAGVPPAFGEVAVPPLKARVTDLSGTLSGAQQQDLERRLLEFEGRKGSQIAVLILPSTQPETIEQYSIRVAEAWKIGRARVDDGVILVVAKDDRRLRVEVGRGLEGAIPDAIAKRIVSDVITPHFKANDFYGGVSAGAGALIKLIEGEPLPAPPASGGFSSGVDFQTIFWLIVALAIVQPLLLRLFGRLTGSLAAGGVVGVIVWVFAGVVVFAVLGAMIAFLVSLFIEGAGSSRGRGWSSGSGGGWSSGGWSGGGDSGGFSGGGGDFGGGGASGSW